AGADGNRRRAWTRAWSGWAGGWGMNALLLSAVLAATPITLDQVRQESRNNLQALLSELDRVRASEQARFSRSALLPQLSMNAQANRTITSTYSSIGTVVKQDAAGNPVLGPNGEIQYVNKITDFPAYAANNFVLGATLNQLLFDLGKFKLLEQSGHLAAAS